MKTNNYDKLVCTHVKELFRTCFTKENLALFDLWELIDISNLCKQVGEEADKTYEIKWKEERDKENEE